MLVVSEDAAFEVHADRSLRIETGILSKLLQHVLQLGSELGAHLGIRRW